MIHNKYYQMSIHVQMQKIQLFFRQVGSDEVVNLKFKSSPSEFRAFSIPHSKCFEDLKTQIDAKWGMVLKY